MAQFVEDCSDATWCRFLPTVSECVQVHGVFVWAVGRMCLAVFCIFGDVGEFEIDSVYSCSR